MRHFRFLSTTVWIKNDKDSNCVIPDDCISSTTISILWVQKENAIFKNYSQQIFRLRVMFIILCEYYCWREGTPGGCFESCHTLNSVGSIESSEYQFRIFLLDNIALELFTENGAGFKMAKNTFNIRCRRLSVALWLWFLVDSLDI